MNKNIITNISALSIILVSLITPFFSYNMLMTGLFALSGSITNSLAIYMLFEKVPLLYGSGVIPARFSEFKLAIKNLIITEFFNQENIAKFFQDSNKTANRLNLIIENNLANRLVLPSTWLNLSTCTFL